MTVADLFSALSSAGIRRAHVTEWQGLGVVLVKCSPKLSEQARATLEPRRPVGVAILFDVHGLAWWRCWFRCFQLHIVPHTARAVNP